MDAINDSCYADMQVFLKKQTDFFNKEMTQWKKKEANLLKKLKTDEEKQEEEKIKEQQKNTATRGGRTQVKVRKKPENPTKRKKATKKKKPTEEEIKKKEQEEEQKKKEEEEAEAKRIEEEEKKKAEEAKNKKKGGKDAPPEEEEPKELTEEEKKEKERQQINKNLEEVKETIKKLDDKLKLIQTSMDEFAEEAKLEKVLDLEDKSGERKYAKTKADQYANEFLSEKMTYVLGKIIRNEQEEEEFKEVKIDGACVRTLEEDANYDPEAEVTDPKKGKGKKK